MPRSLPRLLVVFAAALLVTACATPKPLPPDVSLSRETPEETYEYFKTMARNNQWAGEWAVFSPNFKRMVNQQAGRNVDLGDYSMGRQTMFPNSNSEMQLLLNSTLQGVQYVGADRARITISAGGRTVSPTMIRMTKWELKVRGEDMPASGTVSRPGDAIQVNADGSITVRVQADPGVAAALRTVPRENIEAFSVKSEWYVDDFGGLAGAMGSGAGAQPAQAQPQPGTYAPPPSQPQPSSSGQAAGAVGYGSPG